MPRQRPDIGNWFEDIDSGQLFEIVAIDEMQNTIEVQYADGSLDEFEREDWRQLSLVPAPPPEDANAAYGTAGAEQQSDSIESDFNPLDQLEGDSFQGTDEFP